MYILLILKNNCWWQLAVLAFTKTVVAFLVLVHFLINHFRIYFIQKISWYVTYTSPAFILTIRLKLIMIIRASIIMRINSSVIPTLFQHHLLGTPRLGGLPVNCHYQPQGLVPNHAKLYHRCSYQGKRPLLISFLLGGVSAEQDRMEVRRVRQTFNVRTFVEGPRVRSMESNAS